MGCNEEDEVEIERCVCAREERVNKGQEEQGERKGRRESYRFTGDCSSRE